jgi:serine protease DegS
LPRYRQWCASLEGGGAGRRENSLGSGVIVRADGYIVTNDHVIADADEILVGLSSGQLLQADVIGRDAETDLAVIRVTAEGLAGLKVARSGEVRVGEVALAIGNPFGIGQTVSQGIISAVGRTALSTSPYDDFMQTDAAINPGNSGGALINSEGQLIGINTMILSRSGGSQGIGFAIPSDLVGDVLAEILAHGRVRRGWLGIEVQEGERGASEFGFGITYIEPDGPADQAGLLIDDRLFAIDDRILADTLAMSRYVAGLQPGQDVKVTIERDGAMRDVYVKIEERPGAI